MRIVQLSLIAFGPFRGLDIDLSAPGLHMVFGRNEAGKSTTLRAITGLLYGIDVRTPDAHVHKPAELRVGGTLEGADGARLEIVRRKGISKGAPNTLLDARGQAIDEVVLQRLLRGVSEETFRHAFGLDHTTLAEGAKALLDGRGDIGGSLFDASVGGGGDVRRLLLELEGEADGLYKPRGSTQPLNIALKAFSDLQKAVKEKERLPAAYVLQQKTLEDGQKKRTELGTRRAELAARRAKIDGARRRVPLERRRAQAVATLAALGEIPRHAARIASLHARLAAYEHALVAHRENTASAERLRVSVSDAARRAGVHAGSKDLRIDVRTQSRIHKYVNERTTLTERLETSRLELARNERELERQRAHVQAPEGVDAVAVAALARAVEQARKLGDATSQLATLTSRAARKRADVETRAAALGVFEGPLEELLALRPPSVAALDSLATRASALDRTLARHVERAANLETAALALEQQLAEASGDFAPPTAADLRAAREVRDQAWKHVQNARNENVDAQALAALDSALERAVRDADGVADRMMLDADRVTTLARYRAQQATYLQQRALAAADCKQAAADRAALDDEHRRIWVGAGIAAVDDAKKRRDVGLVEMRGWLVNHGQIVDAFAGVREAEADAEETARNIAAARAELASALGQLLPAHEVVDAKTLPELLDLATARLDHIEGSRRRAAEAARTIVKLEITADERKAGALHDEASLREAKARLAQLVGPLGVPEDADADEVTRALEALRELFSFEDQRADFESRAALAGAQALAFEEEAALAAATLAADLVSHPAREVVAELAARSKKAHAAEDQLTDAEAQLADVVVDGDVVADDILALVADPEAASRALDDVDEKLGELDRELQSETNSIARIEVGLEQMRGESGAAEASAQAQEALARVRVDLERYVRARAAAVLLAREIDRYREENQGPMLTKASQLFARLTLGSFTSVRAGYDDKDKPTIRCVREGSIEVDVAGLSEGTRDQLYLSLRLASLIRYADLAEPMPLVLDDVLIQFDDDRAGAALSVIAEVATRMQVLFFTHHARMLDLARAAVPSSSLTIHELASPAAVAALVPASL